MKYNDEFLLRRIGHLRRRQNETMNVLYRCWKLFKINSQRFFLIEGKIFYYFFVTPHNILNLYAHHKGHKKIV